MYALRMALRQFRLHPAFALITILVLGLGTGAATSSTPSSTPSCCARCRTARPMSW